MNENINNFGQRLLDARKRKNLTQEQLSKLSGVSRQAIYEYEKGKYVPRIDKVSKMAKALDIDLYYLCFGEYRASHVDYQTTYKEVMNFLLSVQEAELFNISIKTFNKQKILIASSTDNYMISLSEQISNIQSLRSSLNLETFNKSLQEILDSYDIAIKDK